MIPPHMHFSLPPAAADTFSPFANREAEISYGVGIRWDGYSVVLL
jgi:hypothetical protein